MTPQKVDVYLNWLFWFKKEQEKRNAMKVVIPANTLKAGDKIEVTVNYKVCPVQ